METNRTALFVSALVIALASVTPALADDARAAPPPAGTLVATATADPQNTGALWLGAADATVAAPPFPEPARARWPLARTLPIGAYLAADIGLCARTDTPTGTNGFCWATGVGGEVEGWDRGRISLEVSAGSTAGRTTVNAGLVTTGGGGSYLGVTAVGSLDLTRLFFVGIGVRWTYFFERGFSGGDAILDLGTRIGDRVEVGSRLTLGVEAVQTSGGGYATTSTSAFALSTSLFVRVFLW